MRAVIYARFSTDKQRETSIDDQARVCRARADRDGWTVGEIYSDVETSGQTRISQRAGAARMLAAIEAGEVDVLVLEALDRLARDLVEQEQVVRRLEHRGLRIIGVADGYDTINAGRKLMRAVRGAINESYIDDLRFKIHRGLAGQVERGYFAGGMSYGYRSVVAGTNARGEPIGYRLEVDQEQARWIRWIFEQYVNGASCQRMAHQLNHLQVPAPGARRRAALRATWCATAFYGSPAKGSGILNNELYVGRYIWNRSQWVKDPDTRKRVRLERPRTEWSIEERPDLRIIDAATWERVRERIDKPRKVGGARGAGRPPRTLFGGLLKCGICGGSVVLVNGTCYGCAAHKDRGNAVCSGLLVSRQATDARLLSLVQTDLRAPGAIAGIRRKVAAQLSTADRQGSQEHAQKRLNEVQREIRNVTDAIASIGLSHALRARLAAAEAKLEALQRNLAPMEAIKPSVDAIMADYKQLLVDLQASLKGDPERARPVLHRLLGDIRVFKEGQEIWAEIQSPAQRLLVASGGGAVDNSGSGDAHPRLSTAIRRRIT